MSIGSVPCVVVADEVSDAAVDLLLSENLNVRDLQKSGIPEDRLIELLTNPPATALIVRSATRVTGKVLNAAAACGLRVVARAGVGVDNIDCEAAKSHGILVINSPDGNTVSAAEHTCALILGLARRFPASFLHQAADWKVVRKRVTGISAPLPITEVAGKTLGVIGLGRIGSAVGERMHAFGMRVIGHDPNFRHNQALPGWLTTCMELEELLPQADYITIHIPLSSATRGLFGWNSLAQCRPGFRLVNCSRGGILEEAALLKALDSQHCAAAALDVFGTEPLDTLDPVIERLVAHPSVILSPHLGASSQEAQVRVALEVARAICGLNASPTMPLCGLEGGVNCNALGKRCQNLFPNWTRSLGLPEVHSIFYFLSAIRSAFGRLMNQVMHPPAASDACTWVYRVSAVVPAGISDCHSTKLLLAEIIANICDLSRTSVSTTEPFQLLALLVRPCLISCSVSTDEVTGAVEVSWIDNDSRGTEKRSICSVVFLQSPAESDVTDRPGELGSMERTWSFTVTFQAINGESRPVDLAPAPLLAQLHNNKCVCWCDEHGFMSSDPEPLVALL